MPHYIYKPAYKLLILLCALSAFISVNVPAMADENIRTEEKLLREEYRRDLAATEKISPLVKKTVDFKYGGWLSSIYRAYTNIDNNSGVKDGISSLWTNEIRLWGRFTFLEHNDIYIRIRQAYSQKKNISNYTGNAMGGDSDGPSLDMAYLTLASRRLKMQIGRQYLSLGRGIAYGDVNDGALVTGLIKSWMLKTFFSHTLPNEDNIDYSVPGYNKKGNSRYFVGIEAAYLGIPKNVFYAFCLAQKDDTKPHPADNAQNYRYDSQHLGTGISGKTKNSAYWTELIKEFGYSHTDVLRGYRESVKKSIDAWAANIGARYEFDIPIHPISETEFAYGSGNKNRINPITTQNGNIYSRDTGFNYFGNYYAGYALSPVLSNIYIYRLDQSIRPFFFLKPLKDLAIGAKYFIYAKDKDEGGFSDTDATASKRYIGNEYNLYLHWKINNNVYFSMRYGDFTPKNAYIDTKRSHTKYGYTRLTFSF